MIKERKRKLHTKSNKQQTLFSWFLFNLREVIFKEYFLQTENLEHTFKIHIFKKIYVYRTFLQIQLRNCRVYFSLDRKNQIQEKPDLHPTFKKKPNLDLTYKKNRVSIRNSRKNRIDHFKDFRIRRNCSDQAGSEAMHVLCIFRVQPQTCTVWAHTSSLKLNTFSARLAP